MNSANQSLNRLRKLFWDTIEPTPAGMLQTENAEVLWEIDTSEILEYLPDCQGKKILDLGAGIGRFTSKLARVADRVTAVDISQSFITQNQINNKNLTNITYMCSDVTEVDFPEGSFDLVFSSWILKYLNDDEVTKLTARILKWLTPAGYFFFRESCFHQIGTINLEGNPTIFRPLLHYCELLHSVSVDNRQLKLLRSKNVQSYLQYQNAPNQLCFLAKKVQVNEESELTRLIENRYSLQSITMIEKIYGGPWVYAGNEQTAKDLMGSIGLRPGQRVLDIGCGTGASALLMAKQYRVNVHGIDISVAMINLAIERQLKFDKELRKLVQFEIGNILEMDFDEGFYDVIYSRECFLYIPNKEQLFDKLYRWLRPGGILFFTDFLKGALPPSKPLSNYLESIKPCFPITTDSYKQAMQSTGFKNLHALDFGEQWVKILHNDLQAFSSTRAKFIGDEMYHDKMCDLWKRKMEWINGKQLTWGVFRANK